MQRADLLEKTLMLGKTEGRRRRGWQRTKWLDGITVQRTLSNLWEMVMDREAWSAESMGSQRDRYDWATEQQQQVPSVVMANIYFHQPLLIMKHFLLFWSILDYQSSILISSFVFRALSTRTEYWRWKIQYFPNMQCFPQMIYQRKRHSIKQPECNKDIQYFFHSFCSF